MASAAVPPASQSKPAPLPPATTRNGTPSISCVVPAYNEAETIESVLRSLLTQTRLPDEIHVTVNNSKDETFVLAAKFA